jgi:hypothetical protein
VQCDLQRFNRWFNPRVALTSSRIHTTIGGLGDRNFSANRHVPGDGIAGELSTDLRGLYHRGNETGGSRRVAPSPRKAGSRLVAGVLSCAGDSGS